MKIESGKNYITRNLDVRTITDINLSQSILSTGTKYDNYRLYSDGRYSAEESSRDHLYKIDTNPKLFINDYFISTLFQIIDYDENLFANTIASINKGYDEEFEILLGDAKENSVLLNYHDGYEKNIVIISFYDNDEIKILDKIQRLNEKINK